MHLQMRGAESVVLAGDPKQLPPTVLSMEAAQQGLTTTLLDRLQAAGKCMSYCYVKMRIHDIPYSYISTSC